MKRVTYNYGVDILGRMIQEFTQESVHSVTFNYNNTMNAIYQRLANEDSVIFINGDYRENTGGFIICNSDTSWYTEPLGYIEKFYVAPLSRGTPIGRELFNEAVNWFDSKDCVSSFLTDTGGVHTDKRLINLAGKFGYLPAGTTLQRKK